MNDKEPVKYKNAFERNEEVRKERLNKAWNINQHPAEKQLTKPKVNSEGAFAAEVKRQKQNGTYGYYNKPENKKKTDVLDYVNKTIEMYEGGEDKIDPPILKNNINNRYVNKSLNKFENRTDDPNTVTFNPTTQLFTNKDRTIAFKDYNSADNHNKSLGVKSKYPTEATPKQFGELAERLERDRQMRGAPTNLKEFGHRFNENKKGPQYPGMKTWEEKKKIPTPREPVKIDLATYTPFVALDMPKRDPEYIRAEKNFNQTLENNRLEKLKNATTGIAGLVGGDPKYGK